MNILFLYGSSIDPIKGGIQRVTYVLSQFFEKKNHKIFFMSLAKSKHDSLLANQFFLPICSECTSTENIMFLNSFIKKKNINIVINQAGIDPKMSRLAYRVKQDNVKLISCIHNSLLASIKNFSSAYAVKAQKYYCSWLLPVTNISIIKRVLLQIYRMKYREHYNELCDNSDKVVLLSDKFREELSFFVPQEKMDKVTAIPNPVSFVEKRQKIKKEKILLYVGRIDSSQKRVDLLLEIWNRLYHKYRDWSLMIVGGGEELEIMKQKAQIFDLQRIYFEGFQDPKSYYEKSGLFCMTSSFEGFGIVLVEAMYYGVVPVAFNSFLSITDIIDDKINGFLVEPFNLDQYTQVLSVLMENDQLREEISYSSIEKSNFFSLETIGQQWLNLMQSF